MRSYEEKAIRRMLEMYAELGERGKQKVIDEIKYEGALAAAAEVKKTKTVVFGELYADVLERQQYFNKFEGYNTGLQYFNDATLGLRGSELIIVAGPSNFGKTMVALNIAVSTVLASKKKVLVISMEMPAAQIAERIYNMAPTERHEEMMENLVIQTELRVSAKHIALILQRENPHVLVVDHIQFLANQEQGAEYERVTAATANLKAIAMKFNIPVIAISHVAKTRSGGQGQATAADLKGSSSIEQDCDIGFMINRLKVDSPEIEITLFKHRTKRPKLFLKPCAVGMDGVAITEGGAYTYDDMVSPTGLRNPWEGEQK